MRGARCMYISLADLSRHVISKIINNKNNYHVFVEKFVTNKTNGGKINLKQIKIKSELTNVCVPICLLLLLI